jgi:hypothetical protein
MKSTRRQVGKVVSNLVLKKNLDLTSTKMGEKRVVGSPIAKCSN